MQSSIDSIYWIVWQCGAFQLLELHQGLWVINWNEKDKKVLKHSISVRSILF